MCDFKYIAVTNRHLCKSKEDFLEQIGRLAEAAPDGIILREKDLPENEYRVLAREVLTICKDAQVPCILHSHFQAAAGLQAEAVHLPMELLRAMSERERGQFTVLGASCHSPEEAAEAEYLGCSYIMAGHIFPTACKQDLPPRGTEFLARVCRAVNIPVYAIGGIDETNINLVRQAGARGACIMSGLMRCEEPREYLARLRG